MKLATFSRFTIFRVACFVSALSIAFSCGKKNSDDTVITINPQVTHQEMIGFGGSLAWYSDLIINSRRKNEICQLLFEDLGTDIIRLKTWYYPDNYPEYKGIERMRDDKSLFQWYNTTQLYQAATHYNPTIKILLTSWGPPEGLKSNASTRQGTLKSDANGFMYDAFAQYWVDMLDHTPFNPDYISIQNEPSYVNAGWTTCQWAPTETESLPGYDKAFDKVYDRIRTRPHAPVMIGPDVATINSSIGRDAFPAYAEALKDKKSLGFLCYHLYNFTSSTKPEETIPPLEALGKYNKPNIMSEFSDAFDWINTALLINNVLVHANASAYLHWKLTWDTTPVGAGNQALISIDANGNYTKTPFYYLIKHYAKYIDAGYKRIEATSTNPGVNVTAFIEPSGKKVTSILINTTDETVPEFQIEGYSIGKRKIFQSTEIELYKTISDASPLSLPPRSVTTVVMDVER